MPTTIRLSPEVEERLNALATKTGRSKSYYLREFIERGLEDLEEFLRRGSRDGAIPPGPGTHVYTG